VFLKQRQEITRAKFESLLREEEDEEDKFDFDSKSTLLKTKQVY